MAFRPDLSWEFLSLDEINSKTLRALRNHIKHLKENSLFYKELLKDIVPEDISNFEDFSHLPFTDRKDIVEKSSYFLGVSPAQVVETVITAGTTGTPIPFVFTKSDIERIAFSHALSFHSIGVTALDRVFILLSLDRFSLDGMGVYHGLLMLNSKVMRIGIGATNISLLQQYLQLFKPTVLVAQPSVLKNAAIELNKKNFDTQKSSVKKVIVTGESIYTEKLEPNIVCKKIEELWGAEAFSIYSTTELAVAYGDCIARFGGHSHPELVYTEIVDSNGKAVSDGEIGELVATPLGVEGVPLLRYRTGDITFKISKGCKCGRNSCRIGPVLGKKSQLLSVNGKIIYPLIVTTILDSIEEIKDYLIILENENSKEDTITIHVAAPPSSLESISRKLKEATGVFIQVIVSNIPTIQSLRRGTTKRSTIVDLRGVKRKE
ncbi:MAG: hypothetical protein N2053_01305 [Chitinispirillaceae bacterium]|nr:hypothetical protein [Chitinispirillaceae bacterium]